MSMFSSRPPFNDDPYPNVWNGHSPRNQMRVDTDMYRRGAPYNHERYSYKPRPEFDRPQHNPTNPILAKFRERSYPVAYWVHRLSKGDLPDGVEASIEQIDHAHRVLTRLANLTKEDAA